MTQLLPRVPDCDRLVDAALHRSCLCSSFAGFLGGGRVSRFDGDGQRADRVAEAGLGRLGLRPAVSTRWGVDRELGHENSRFRVLWGAERDGVRHRLRIDVAIATGASMRPLSGRCISQSADTVQSLSFGAEFRKETTQVGGVKIKGSCVETLGRGASCHGSYVRETVGKSQYLHGMCSMWRNM